MLELYFLIYASEIEEKGSTRKQNRNNRIEKINKKD